MTPLRHADRKGFALLPVVLTLALLGATAYLMTRESTLGGELVSVTQRQDRARYLAEAALRHADWQVQSENCSGFSDVSTTSFGYGSYDATVTPGNGSPVSVVATGTLADGSTHTLARTAMRVYESTVQVDELRPGAGGEDAYVWDGAHKDKNFGATAVVKVNNASASQHTLLRFDLSSLPPDVHLVSAELGLYLEGGDDLTNGRLDVHRVTRTWMEGDQDDQTTTLGVTFQEAQLGTAWSSAGGDYDPTPAASVTVPGLVLGWQAWNVTGLVDGWLSGAHPNDGLLIRGGAGLVEKIAFTSGDGASSAQHPVLTLTYTCECGQVCGAGAGSDTIVLSTDSEAILGGLSFSDIDLAEYDPATDTASLFFDGSLTTLDSDIDAVHLLSNGHLVLSTKNTTNLGGGGLLVEPADLVKYDPVTDTATTLFDGSLHFDDPDENIVSVHVMENGHFVLSTDSDAILGGLSFTDIDLVEYDPATDTASLFFDGSLTTLNVDISAVHLLSNGHLVLAAKANPTAILGGVTFEAGDLVDYDPGTDTAALIFDGSAAFSDPLEKILSVHVGAGSGGARVLYVVKDPDNPSLQELARETLMVDWGFAVTLFDDDSTLAEFVDAATGHDVAYVSQEALEDSLGTKLVDAAIGVVNESRDMIDVFGFAASASAAGGLPTLNVDPGHFITSVFPTETVAPYGVNEWYQIASMPVAEGVQPVGVWVESPWADRPALMALDAGADVFGGGAAAGRRVQIPMGAGQGLDPVDVNGLSDDGRTIIERSIRWAGGEGCGSLKALLLVVSDAAVPLPQETARQTLLESWCYKVTLIDDDAGAGEFAEEMELNDVIYISQEITALSAVSKLKDASIGIVNEEYLISSALGIGSGTGTGFFNDINIVDNTHYITSGFGSGPLALFSPSYDIYTGTGFTLAPDLQVLGETGSITGLAALDTGGALWDSGAAAARRVLVPWGDDFSALNSDGRSLMRRSIEWAAASGGPPKRLLFVVGNPGNLSSEEAAHETLLISWNYDIELIDDDASQLDFDTAVSNNDVAFVTNGITASRLNTKLVDAPIGVVTSEDNLSDEFGLSSSIAWDSGIDVELNDNLHYITSPFGLGLLTTFSTSESLAYLTGSLSPDLAQLASSASGYGIVTLDPGGAMVGGGNAAGRRVQLPWGGNGFAPGDLTANGETLLRRALAWGTGEGASGKDPVGPPIKGGGSVVYEEFTEGRRVIDTGTGVTIPKPSGTAEGDLLIVAVATDGDTVATLSPSASWNMTQLDVGGRSGEVTLGVWWKIADGTEPTDLTCQWTGGEQAYGWIMRFTGHDPSSPIATASMTSGTNRAPLSTNLITSTDGNLILRLGGFDDDDITLDVPGLSGHTAITMDRSNTGTNAVSGGAGYLIQTTAGDTDTSNFNLTAREQFRTITIAIRPAP